MIETGVVLLGHEPIYWHLPPGRTGGSLPDSRALWDVLWEHRKDETLGFAHSHPGGGVPGPSWTDITTFSGVELGLGRRIDWWITSSESVILLRWIGPAKYDYDANLQEETPWADRLREFSKGT